MSEKPVSLAQISKIGGMPKPRRNFSIVHKPITTLKIGARARRVDVEPSNSEHIDLRLSCDVFSASRVGKPVAFVCSVVHNARLWFCVADRGTELRQELYSLAFRLDSDPRKYCCISRGLVAPSIAISLREEAIELGPT